MDNCKYSLKSYLRQIYYRMLNAVGFINTAEPFYNEGEVTTAFARYKRYNQVYDFI